MRKIDGRHLCLHSLTQRDQRTPVGSLQRHDSGIVCSVQLGVDTHKISLTLQRTSLAYAPPSLPGETTPLARWPTCLQGSPTGSDGAACSLLSTTPHMQPLEDLSCMHRTIVPQISTLEPNILHEQSVAANRGVRLSLPKLHREPQKCGLSSMRPALYYRTRSQSECSFQSVALASNDAGDGCKSSVGTSAF